LRQNGLGGPIAIGFFQGACALEMSPNLFERSRNNATKSILAK
jgi:hypothetical protein